MYVNLLRVMLSYNILFCNNFPLTRVYDSLNSETTELANIFLGAGSSHKASKTKGLTGCLTSMQLNENS